MKPKRKMAASASALFLRAARLARDISKNVGGKLFSRYLLATNCTLSASLSFTGDVLMQRYEISKGKNVLWDSKRSRDMSVSGLTIGVLCHYWYIWLDKTYVGRSAKILAKKITIDQFVLSPVLICVFFATVGALEGNDARAVGRELAEKGYKLYLAEFFVWPAAQLFSFYFLPTRYRVLYDNAISLGFDVYTSHVKHDKPETKSDNPPLITN